MELTDDLSMTVARGETLEALVDFILAGEQSEQAWPAMRSRSQIWQRSVAGRGNLAPQDLGDAGRVRCSTLTPLATTSTQAPSRPEPWLVTMQ